MPECDLAAAVLAPLHQTPEETLLQKQADNRNPRDECHTWERFTDRAIVAIESAVAPAMRTECAAVASYSGSTGSRPDMTRCYPACVAYASRGGRYPGEVHRPYWRMLGVPRVEDAPRRTQQ